MRSKYAYVTTLTTINYLKGVKALKKSLENVKTQYPLVILVPAQKKDLFKAALIKEGIVGKQCLIVSRKNFNIKNNNCPSYKYWSNTFLKIQCTSLIEYKKIILIDSDMMVIKNIDHLFSKPNYSAAIAGKTFHKNWENLNSGLMVLQPSTFLFKKLCINMEKLLKIKKNNIGDQDVFIRAYKNWKNNEHLLLPEIYNVLFNEMRYFLLLSNYKSRDICVIHFAGRIKPWDKKYKFKVIGYLLLLRIKQLCFLNKYKKLF